MESHKIPWFQTTNQTQILTAIFTINRSALPLAIVTSSALQHAAAAPRGQLAIRLQHAENRAEHLFEEVLSECRFKEPNKEFVKITLLM
jgi:hypothetical protein